MCYQGAECPYLHRLPTSADNEAMARTISMDIFGRCGHTPRQTRPDMQHAHVSSSRAGCADGSSVAAWYCSLVVCREKMPAGLENKKGAGSYELDMTTLYVHYGGAGHYAVPQLRHLLLEVRIHRSSLFCVTGCRLHLQAHCLQRLSIITSMSTRAGRRIQSSCCRAAATRRAHNTVGAVQLPAPCMWRLPLSPPAATLSACMLRPCAAAGCCCCRTLVSLGL